jgi:hypothetical protein
MYPGTALVLVCAWLVVSAAAAAHNENSSGRTRRWRHGAKREDEQEPADDFMGEEKAERSSGNGERCKSATADPSARCAAGKNVESTRAAKSSGANVRWKPRH